MADLTDRVNVLERDVDRQGIKIESTVGDVHDIKKQVEHIETDMSELKSITKNNASANLKTSNTLNDLLLEVSSFKGGGRVIVWMVTVFGVSGIVALGVLIKTLSGINGS